MTVLRKRARHCIGLIGTVGFFALAGQMSAQVRLLPRTTFPDSTENYVLQVANDRGIAITRIELRIPRSLKVISIGETEAGWTSNLTLDGSRISSVVWTGSLPAARFVQFGFIAKNPNENVRLFWPVSATLADGNTIFWWSGGIETTKTPVTLVVAPHVNRTLTLAMWVCLTALVLALVALVLAIRSGPVDAMSFQPGAE